MRWVCDNIGFRLVGQTLWNDRETVSIHLSRTEADLLRILVQRQGQVVSRSVLSWAAQCSGGRVIDAIMVRLRRKIRAVTSSDDDLIPSVRGLGYRIS